MRFRVPRWFRISFVVAHAGFSLIALVASPAAGISVAAVSVLAFGRYAAMLAFTRSLRQTKAMLFAGAWLACVAGLGLAIVAVALRFRAALPWAAAAACLGPAAVTAWAVAQGLRGMAQSGTGEKAVPTSGQGDENQGGRS